MNDFDDEPSVFRQHLSLVNLLIVQHQTEKPPKVTFPTVLMVGKTSRSCKQHFLLFIFGLTQMSPSTLHSRSTLITVYRLSQNTDLSLNDFFTCTENICVYEALQTDVPCSDVCMWSTPALQLWPPRPLLALTLLPFQISLLQSQQ